jgi:hypothetical protein
LRGRLTGLAPFRCYDCDWRGWRRSEVGPKTVDCLRPIHDDLTDAELDELDPDAVRGERL